MVSPRKYSLKSILKRTKKMSKRVFDYQLLTFTAKSRVFTTLTFAAVFFLIYSDSLVSNLSISSTDLSRGDIFKTGQSPAIKTQTRSSSLPLAAMQEKLVKVESEAVDPLIPPFNVTMKERTHWFQRKLPELEILHSNDLSRKFHGRVLEFLNKGCAIQFYMIWLSPASTFGPRQFLAVDSLFKANPHACLIMLSRSMDSVRGYQILKPILDLGYKLLAVTPDLPFLVTNTPAQAWLDEMKSGRRDPGAIPLSINLSNLIRFAMLYKYGGVYLDTDFIILKDFAGLRNAVGAQSKDEARKRWTRINGAVMVFDINHPILAEFLHEFATTFSGNRWGHNGPYLISRVIDRVGRRRGYNVTVLPPAAFYPLDWFKIHRLFRKPKNAIESRWVDQALLELKGSYAIHLWNRRSRDLIINNGSVMDRLIADHCVVCQHIKHS